MTRFADNNDDQLCNFIIRVLSVDEIYEDEESKPDIYVEFCFSFGESAVADEPIYRVLVKDIDNMHWKTIDLRCCYNLKIKEKMIEKSLSQHVRQSLTAVPKKQIYRFNRTGMYEIKGRPVYCTGVDVIRGQEFASDILFEVAPMVHKLDIDVDLPEEEAATEFFRLLTLSPNPARLILAYKLGFFMRLAYEKIGKIPKGCIYLYGQSGTQKTTFTSFLTQTNDRSNGIKSPSRLNASIPAAVKMLLENFSDVVVMDDLYPADSNRQRNQQEDVLIEITRYIADGTVPTKMKGNELLQGYPRCGVIFTGEYLIGKGSDAARLLPVEMEKPDIKELQYFQKHPLIVSTFYRYFIIWFIDHYDLICDTLAQMMESYENLALNVHDRLREMYFFLGSSYFLFLQYLYDKKILTELDARRLFQSFNSLLLLLIKQQNERVTGEQPEMNNAKNHLQQIRMLYKSGQLSIAKDTLTFDKDRHDGLLYRNKLYLRGNKISVYFPESSINEIADSLVKQGALEIGKVSRTKQISRLKGLRFYVIPLSKLQ